MSAVFCLLNVSHKVQPTQGKVMALGHEYQDGRSTGGALEPRKGLPTTNTHEFPSRHAYGGIAKPEESTTKRVLSWH